MSVSEVRNTGLEDDVAPNKKGRIMNYDRQLAKYARQLDNPKYYGKIIDIIRKADLNNYAFKNFNAYDLEKITGEICAYYDAIKTDEEDKRMIHYFNNACFLISDKNYILAVTENKLDAYILYLKMKVVIFLARIKQLFRTDLYIDIENVNNEIFICKGALTAARQLNADVFELENYFA